MECFRRNCERPVKKIQNIFDHEIMWKNGMSNFRVFFSDELPSETLAFGAFGFSAGSFIGAGYNLTDAAYKQLIWILCLFTQ